MAKSVLSHGQGSEVRKLANEIVEAQQKEIAFIGRLDAQASDVRRARSAREPSESRTDEDRR